jgi:chromosomal replication initiation ATPase DnaA
MHETRNHGCYTIGAASWFGGLTVQATTQSEVIMGAPSKFVRHWIEQHLLQEGLLASIAFDLSTGISKPPNEHEEIILASRPLL